MFLDKEAVMGGGSKSIRLSFFLGILAGIAVGLLTLGILLLAM